MDILNQIDSNNAVSFSGHRPDRLPGHGDLDAPETQKLIINLRKRIEDAIKRDKNTYINGFMAGWDILAAEQVIALKENYPHIRLVTIAPFSVHYFSREKCWTAEWVKRAKDVCRWQETGIKIAEHYRMGIYYERNRSLVDNSSELFCYWDGGKGGTEQTVNYAKHKKLIIYNFFEENSI